MARYHIEIIDCYGETPPTSKYADMVFAAFATGDSIELEAHMNGCMNSDPASLAAALENELEEITKQCGVRKVKRMKRILRHKAKKKSKGK